jgi:hypothetical protein
MESSNAGVPVAPPASTATRHGPFSIWRGHPSPIPWFGRFDADSGFAYQISDRESDEAFGPVCSRCIVGLIYRFRGFCDLTWNPLRDTPCYCDWCDRLLD